MKVENINIDKSIRYGRILYKWNFGRVYNQIIEFVILLSSPVFYILCFFGIIKVAVSASPFLPVVNIFLFIMGSWIITGLCLRGKLVCIKGGGLPGNRESVVEFLKLKFPNTKIITGTERYKFGIEKGRWGFDKSIIILFDDENAYINKFIVAQYDTRSLFPALFYYLSLLRFKKALLRKNSHKNIA